MALKERARTHEGIHAASVALGALELGARHRAESSFRLEKDAQGGRDLLDLLLIRNLAALCPLDVESIAEALVVPINGRLPHIKREIAQNC